MRYYFHRSTLLIKRLLFGKLSSSYFFGVENFKSHYPEAKIKKSRCFRAEAILHFDKVFNRKRDAFVYDTLGVIQFNSSIWDLTCQHIFKKKGEPDGVQYERIGEKLIKVICYRETMQERKIREHYIFLDNHFIMGEYEFLSPKQSTLDAVRDTLQAKYHIRTGETATNFYIQDKHGSLIYFNDLGFDFSVQYYFPQMRDLDQHLQNFIQNASFGKKPKNEIT